MFQGGHPPPEPLRALLVLYLAPQGGAWGRSFLVIREILILEIFTPSVVPFREPYR